MIKESALGIGSFALTLAGWAIAQVDVPAIPTNVGGLITQAGGLGLAVWLVYHHTTITIPNMQKLHSEERTASQKGFEKILDDKRQEYFKEIERQREQFSTVMEKASCRFRGDQ